MRGEQEPVHTTICSGDQTPGRKVDADRLGQTIRRNRMKQIKTSDRLAAVAETATDNVLDFGSTLRELRKNVDPNLVRQREGWRDRNGNVQMVEYVEWHTVADIWTKRHLTGHTRLKTYSRSATS